MAKPDKRTVCLLGPSRSGKSSLIRTMRQCLRLQSYGYQPGHIASIELKEIDKDDFDDGLPDSDGRILTRFPVGKHASEEKAFLEREGGLELPSYADDGPIKYYFSLQCTMAPPQEGGPQSDAEIYLLQVVDAAGELSTASGPHDEALEYQLDEGRSDFDDILRETDGVILVVPPADGHPEDWATHVLDALHKLAQHRPRRLQQIVVVFSQYDRLFTRCGKDAADIAVLQETVLYSIQREYSARQWLRRFVELPHKVPGLQIYFTVASALGFVIGFGNPNIDPNVDIKSRARFRTTNSNGAEAAPLWRPFLTLDPFVLATTGYPSAYAFSLKEVAGIRDEPPEEPIFTDEPASSGDGKVPPMDEPDVEPQPAPPRPSLISRLFGWFNAAGKS